MHRLRQQRLFLSRVVLVGNRAASPSGLYTATKLRSKAPIYHSRSCIPRLSSPLFVSLATVTVVCGGFRPWHGDEGVARSVYCFLSPQTYFFQWRSRPISGVIRRQTLQLLLQSFMSQCHPHSHSTLEAAKRAIAGVLQTYVRCEVL